MKKYGFLVSFAMVVVFTPMAVAAPPSCTWFPAASCDWMIDGDFTVTSSWTATSPTTQFPTIADPCLWGAPPNKVGQVGTGQSLQSSTTFVDSTYHSMSGFELSFYLYLVNDTNNFYDQLKITVRNVTDGTTETRTIRGDQYTSGCARYRWTLSNNYRDKQVWVKFQNAPFATGQWQMDNVSFTSN